METSERLRRHLDCQPSIHPSAFVAPSAALIGNVTLGENSSVWYQTVLRADINRIVIGEGSNIQDGSVIHLDDDQGTEVGSYVTVGHKALLHACVIGDETLVGMGAIILDGAKIGPRCIIGAGALVTKGTVIPEGSMVLGSPAKIRRALDLDEQKDLRRWAEKYVIVSRAYLERGLAGR